MSGNLHEASTVLNHGNEHCSEPRKDFYFIALSKGKLLIFTIHLKCLLFKFLKASPIYFTKLSWLIFGEASAVEGKHPSDMSLRNGTDTWNVWCCFDFCCYWRDQLRRLKSITSGYYFGGCAGWDLTVYRHFQSDILYTRALPNNNRKYLCCSEKLPRKTRLQITLYLMCWHFSHQQSS